MLGCGLPTAPGRAGPRRAGPRCAGLNGGEVGSTCLVKKYVLPSVIPLRSLTVGQIK